MWKLVLLTMTILCCATWGIFSQEPARENAKSPPAQAKPDAGTTEIQDALRVYMDAFNKHEAKNLASHWSENCLAKNSATGLRTQGRANVESNFQSFFKENPEARLSVRLLHHRFIRPDVLSIDGETTITIPNQEPDENVFSAVLVKHDGKWLIDQAQESPKSAAGTAREALSQLDWMVGSWVDESKDITVETQITWSEKKAFLIRKYSVQFADDSETQSGTQVIGWDPRGKLIRSWVFGSDGSFGEGTWAQSGQEWRVKFNHVNSDGSVLSGMQIITKLDNDSATVQMLGQDLDGEPLPASAPVKIVRKAPVSQPHP